jgi:hypothetical protein
LVELLEDNLEEVNEQPMVKGGGGIFVMGIVLTIIVVAVGSAIGLALISKTDSLFSTINSYTTASGSTVSVLAASHTVTATALVTFNETHPATVGTSQAGQAFKLAFSYPIPAILTTASFKLNKTGSPTGNLTAILYAASGTYGTDATPTGSALDTSAILDIATGLNATSVYYNFTFTGAYVLQPDTAYCIAVGVNAEDNMDDSNNVQIAYSTGHAGNRFNFTDNAYSKATTDVLFYVYGSASVSDMNAYRANSYWNSTVGTFYASWPLLGLVVLALIGGAVIIAIGLIR